MNLVNIFVILSLAFAAIGMVCLILALAGIVIKIRGQL